MIANMPKKSVDELIAEAENYLNSLDTPLRKYLDACVCNGGYVPSGFQQAGESYAILRLRRFSKKEVSS